MFGLRSVVIGVVFIIACQREKPQPVKWDPIEPVAAATTTGDAACDAYLRRVAACAKLTPGMRETLAHGGGVWKRAVDQAGAPAKAASESCAGVAKLAGASLTELGC
jgi:hypothetical protein